jgi:hypothetical protein
MPKSLSTTAKQAIFSQTSDEVFLVLVTVDHPDMAQPIRVTSDGVDTISRGNTFIPFPFSLTLPSESEDSPPRAILSISNVNLSVITEIRKASVDPPPSVLIEIVLASDPDTVEVTTPTFELQNVSYTAAAIQGNLGVESLVGEPFPAGRITPANFPGAFA